MELLDIDEGVVEPELSSEALEAMAAKDVFSERLKGQIIEADTREQAEIITGTIDDAHQERIDIENSDRELNSELTPEDQLAATVDISNSYTEFELSDLPDEMEAYQSYEQDLTENNEVTQKMAREDYLAKWKDYVSESQERVNDKVAEHDKEQETVNLNDLTVISADTTIDQGLSELNGDSFEVSEQRVIDQFDTKMNDVNAEWQQKLKYLMSEEGRQSVPEGADFLILQDELRQNYMNARETLERQSIERIGTLSQSHDHKAEMSEPKSDTFAYSIDDLSTLSSNTEMDQGLAALSEDSLSAVELSHSIREKYTDKRDELRAEFDTKKSYMQSAEFAKQVPDEQERAAMISALEGKVQATTTQLNADTRERMAELMMANTDRKKELAAKEVQPEIESTDGLNPVDLDITAETPDVNAEPKVESFPHLTSLEDVSLGTVEGLVGDKESRVGEINAKYKASIKSLHDEVEQKIKYLSSPDATYVVADEGQRNAMIDELKDMRDHIDSSLTKQKETMLGEIQMSDPVVTEPKVEDLSHLTSLKDSSIDENLGTVKGLIGDEKETEFRARIDVIEGTYEQNLQDLDSEAGPRMQYLDSTEAIDLIPDEKRQALKAELAAKHHKATEALNTQKEALLDEFCIAYATAKERDPDPKIAARVAERAQAEEVEVAPEVSNETIVGDGITVSEINFSDDKMEVIKENPEGVTIDFSGDSVTVSGEGADKVTIEERGPINISTNEKGNQTIRTGEEAKSYVEPAMDKVAAAMEKMKAKMPGATQSKNKARHSMDNVDAEKVDVVIDSTIVEENHFVDGELQSSSKIVVGNKEGNVDIDVSGGASVGNIHMGSDSTLIVNGETIDVNGASSISIDKGKVAVHRKDKAAATKSPNAPNDGFTIGDGKPTVGGGSPAETPDDRYTIGSGKPALGVGNPMDSKVVMDALKKMKDKSPSNNEPSAQDYSDNVTPIDKNEPTPAEVYATELEGKLVDKSKTEQVHALGNAVREIQALSESSSKEVSAKVAGLQSAARDADINLSPTEDEDMSNPEAVQAFADQWTAELQDVSNAERESDVEPQKEKEATR